MGVLSTEEALAALLIGPAGCLRDGVVTAVDGFMLGEGLETEEALEFRVMGCDCGEVVGALFNDALYSWDSRGSS